MINCILLIDDDTVANYLHESIISESGLVKELRMASNGLEALQFLKGLSEGDTHPDLILVDLRMPVLEGFEFLDFFNHLSFPGKEKIKIVVLSSSGLKEDIERAKELGAIDSIVKPLNEQKLRKILETHFYKP